MYTQCPHCQTLFRIHAEQIRAAGGQVRCYRCSEIFNAVEQLQDSTTITSGPAVDDSSQLPPLPVEAAASQQQQTRSAVPVEDLYEISLDQLFETTDTEESIDTAEWEAPSPFVQDTESPIPEEDFGLHGEIPEQPQENLPEAGEEDSRQQPETNAAPPEALPTEPGAQPFPTGRRSGWGTLAWSLAILLLLVTALGQLTWLDQDRLLRLYPQTRPAMEWFCQHAKCKLPPRKNPALLKVVERSISTYPDIPNALKIHLTFSNQADFPQPCPRILLNLYHNDEQPLARRSFYPGDYKCPTASNHSLIQPGESVALDLVVEDPGEKATGFEFLFF